MTAYELMDTRKLLKAALLLCGYSDDDAEHYLTVYREDIEADALRARRERIASIEHPCHDDCFEDLHVDCQCAAWIRQEAIRAVGEER